MNFLVQLFGSSVGRKFLVALSSLGLVLFLIVHLLGNLLLFQGAEAFNSYAVTLRTYPALLWFLRLGLLGIFLLHMALGLQLSLENRRARPVRYARTNTVQASLASRIMALSGLVMLSYIAYHLLHFSFGLTHPQYSQLKDDLGRPDVYSMVVLSFQEAALVFVYVLALFFTFLHLSHGVPGLFQSIGWNSPSHIKAIKLLGKSFAMLLFLAYSSIPISVYIGFVRLP